MIARRNFSCALAALLVLVPWRALYLGVCRFGRCTCEVARSEFLGITHIHEAPQALPASLRKLMVRSYFQMRKSVGNLCRTSVTAPAVVPPSPRDLHTMACYGFWRTWDHLT
ncbi:hypothetical protein [Anaplasma marginale]|uniref:hypothetical protein n=1 Tax=Anaplasma marginale TaxID=770 RepID=UPI0002F33CC8|nr:hypothetical protein [Anaplasma marginale]